MKTAIIIPARLAATRLPHKPLLLIHGTSMISRVYQQAIKANLGPVYVACDGPEIASVIALAGGTAILTPPQLPSGTDRIYAAFKTIPDHKSFDAIINLQGDLPFIDPSYIQKSLTPLKKIEFDIGTLGAPILKQEQWENSSVVKMVTDLKPNPTAEAITFTRGNPKNQHKNAFYHIGIYAYRPYALEKFVQALPSENEKIFKLEQLRALDMGMRIGASIVTSPPLSIDTPEDYEEALSYKQLSS